MKCRLSGRCNCNHQDNTDECHTYEPTMPQNRTRRAISGTNKDKPIPDRGKEEWKCWTAYGFEPLKPRKIKVFDRE